MTIRLLITYRVQKHLFTTEAQGTQRESLFFPGRETAAREKKPPASPNSTGSVTAASLLPACTVPAGLRAFAQSELVPSSSRDLPIGQKRDTLCVLSVSAVDRSGSDRWTDHNEKTLFTTEAQRAQRESVFFPGRETAAREKKPPASPNVTWAATGIWLLSACTVPAGLRAFARSPSPDRAKRKSTLCPLCLCGENVFCSSFIRGIRMLPDGPPRCLSHVGGGRPLWREDEGRGEKASGFAGRRNAN
jgi:hypothetical protein